MADLNDVLLKLVDLSTSAVYPNGTSQPSVAGVDVTLQAGWVFPQDLDKFLLDGKAMVSVYPTKIEKPVTKFQRILQKNTVSPATLTATVLNNTVTIGGTVTVPQAVSVRANYVTYAYQVLVGDTTATIATALAALIPNATVLGSVITITDLFSISARVIVNATSSKEIRRVERVFMITTWAPNNTIRTAISSAIDVYLTNLPNISFILPDNYYALIWYMNSQESDDNEEARVFRRDLNFKVQYATTVTENSTLIGDPFVNQTFSYQT